MTQKGDQTPSATARPRVLVVTLGRRGGTTRYGWLMGRGLASVSEVAVISSSGAENRERWSELDVPHLETKTFSGIPTMLLSYLAVGRFLRMRRFAREFDPDVIYYPHGHAWKPVLDILLPRRAKTLLTIHDPELHAGEDSILFRGHDWVNRRRVHGYVLLNEAQREGFVRRLGLDPERVAVVPLGAFDDTPEDRLPLAAVPGFESIAGYSGRYLLFVGRLAPYKGLASLLEAYRDSVAVSGTPLVIAGSGDLSSHERELLSQLRELPVVVVNRWLSDAELASIVAAARFVVLPYLSATQSGVIPLASSFGVPALASDAGGISEQVHDGDTGMLFRAGDAAALADRLTQALSMGDHEYARMSAGCRALFSTAWSWDALATEVLVFADALPDRPC